MPCFSKRLARQARDLGVLDREDLRQHLDHGDVGAHGVEERGELDADRAGADHQQRFRHPLRHHRLEIGPDQFLVGLQPRQHARPRAGGEDDVLGLIGALAQRALRRLDGGLLHRDLAGRVDRGVAPDHRHLVLLHQEADAVIEAFRDAARARHHGLRIERDFFGGQPVILGVLHVVVDLGRAQQRLGRDAAPVQADAAEIGFFDDRGLETELRGADRGDVAAGAGADDDDVEGCVGHGYALVVIVRPSCFSGHCEEPLRRSNPHCRGKMDCFAALAMTAYSSHTIIITGFSISRLNAPISSAPSAPSMAR